MFLLGRSGNTIAYFGLVVLHVELELKEDNRPQSARHWRPMAWHCGADNCPTHTHWNHQCLAWRIAILSGSVGVGGRNNPADVRIIQGALNRFSPDCGGPTTRLDTDGKPSEMLFQSIRRFQKRHFGVMQPDGRVDIAGQTYKALAGRITIKRIEVNLSEQRVEAIQNGRAIYNFECVTGDQNHQTSKGVFTIFRKQHPHRSTKYS